MSNAARKALTKPKRAETSKKNFQSLSINPLKLVIGVLSIFYSFCGYQFFVLENGAILDMDIKSASSHVWRGISRIPYDEF